MRYAVLTFLTLITTFLHALEVGEPAPSLASVKWVKNGPVEIGRSLTVVEFWATWCGPCKTSIPKLTALNKKYHDRLIVVGLSNEELPTLAPFVTAQGTAMDYQVGMVDEAVHEGYMAGRDGIPYSFLIGADGKVIWHGHPMALKKVVAAVLAGTWNATSEARRAQQQQQELQTLLNSDPAGNEDALLARIQEKTALILATDPLDQEALDLRLNIAKHQKDAGLFRATLTAIPVDQLETEQAATLTMMLVQDEQPANRHLDLAYAFAQRAVGAEPTSAEAHAALAAVWHALGFLDRARGSQERAVAIDPADESQLATLAFYREAQRLAGLIGDGKPLTAPAASSVARPAPVAQPAGPAGPASLVP
jgi:thiol-disulfide isomerase/thioredoxin/Flp pilus assembly protein TadD